MDDTTTTGAGGDTGGDGPGNPAFEQLQRAALDAVDAARAMLDAAESMIRDPAAVEAVVNTVTAVARQAGDAVAGFAAGTATTADADAADDGDDEADGGFERITVE
ncbi:MAG: hypothetical protein U5K30_01285 [Acidimicrobiales bacterium]|nr:hypothetical protein [Acidimicrobiales bacterium]